MTCQGPQLRPQSGHKEPELGLDTRMRGEPCGLAVAGQSYSQNPRARMVTQGAHQLFQPRGFLAAAGELVHSGRKDGFVQQLLLVGSATRVTLGTKWAWRGLVGVGWEMGACWRQAEACVRRRRTEPLVFQAEFGLGTAALR